MNINKDPLFKILEATTVQQLGIVPLQLGQERLDVNRTIEESPTCIDARVVKRKFRKAWRKAARRLLIEASGSKSKSSAIQRYLSTDMGLGSPQPSKRNKMARKREVALMVRRIAMEAKKKLASTK